jgi:hypothetical protein
VSSRWRDRARCIDAVNEPGDWTLFPEDRHPAGSKPYLERVTEVRESYCGQCPVRVECLRDGLLEEFGMFGGLTQDERRQVTQLVCACGNDIDPLDMLDRNRRHFCGNCRPIVFERSVG